MRRPPPWPRSSPTSSSRPPPATTPRPSVSPSSRMSSAPTALQPDGVRGPVRHRRGRHGRCDRGAGSRIRPCRPPSPRDRRRSTRCSARPNPAWRELVDALRTAVAGRPVLAQPYVEVSPDSLVPAGLFGEINEQTASGRAVLTDELGAEPVGSVALSPPAPRRRRHGHPRGPGRAARRRGELAARTARLGDHQLLPRPTLRARAPRGDVRRGGRGRRPPGVRHRSRGAGAVDDRRIAGPRGQPRARRARAPAPRAAERRAQHDPAPRSQRPGAMWCGSCSTASAPGARSRR